MGLNVSTYCFGVYRGFGLFSGDENTGCIPIFNNPIKNVNIKMGVYMCLFKILLNIEIVLIKIMQISLFHSLRSNLFYENQ